MAVAAVASCLIGAVAWWSWFDAWRPVALPDAGAIVFVPDGASFRGISQRLADAGVIRHGLNLRLWARWTGADRQMRRGEYLFRGSVSPLQVLDRLRSGKDGLHSVTIPEGSTLNAIAAAFEAAGFGGADQFRCVATDPQFLLDHALPASGAEGYLYPDTYRFDWSTTPKEVLAAMLRRYREEAIRLEAERQRAGLSEHSMVTLASIIERETGLESERALVAAVFRNRLRIGMRLQADPTTVYGLDVDRPPTAADLDTENPYNTYLHDGLPPGPICSPGRDALKAALAPAAVDYLYFVARGDGSHVFSTHLAEHNLHVQALRRRRSVR